MTAVTFQLLFGGSTPPARAAYVTNSGLVLTGLTNTNTFSIDCGNGGDVVTLLGASGTGGITFSTVTIGGVSATVNVQVSTGGSNVPCGIASARGCPSGVQNVVVTLSGNAASWVCHTLNMTGVGSITPTATGSDSHAIGGESSTLSNPANGCTVAVGMCTNGGAPTVWTGLTKDADVGATTFQVPGAHQNFITANAALAWTITYGGSNNQTAGCWASWGTT